MPDEAPVTPGLARRRAPADHTRPVAGPPRRAPRPTRERGRAPGGGVEGGVHMPDH